MQLLTNLQWCVPYSPSASCLKTFPQIRHLFSDLKLNTCCIMQPTKEVFKPDNQLQLSEKDMQEEIAKMLTANNPSAPKNTARFNMKERVYKLEPMVDQLLVHYATDGWLLHKASEDARKQQEVEKQSEEAAARFQAEVQACSCMPHSHPPTMQETHQFDCACLNNWRFPVHKLTIGLAPCQEPMRGIATPQAASAWCCAS